MAIDPTKQYSVTPVVCPDCKSYRVAYFKYDSDWGYAGYYGAANDDTDVYNDNDLYDFDHDNRPDIDINMCLDCNRLWWC